MLASFMALASTITYSSKKWLQSGSLIHRTLRNVVYDKNLLQDIKKLTGFNHTDSLEVFHSSLVKYCLKRQHCSY